MSATVTHLPARQRTAPELERLVIGGLLDLHDKAPGLVEAAGLTPEDFLDPTMRETWFCVAGMSKAKRLVTAQTVFATAVRLKRLADTAEASEALSLAASSNALTAKELLQAARDLRRVATLRRVRQALIAEAQALELSDAQPARVASTLESIASRLAADFEPDTDASGDVFELHDGWNQHREKGTSALVPSGIQVLDEAIGGGFPSRVTLVIADSGVGKTTVFASMIRAMLEASPALTLGVFGLEDGVTWLPKRWAAADLGLPQSQVGWAKLSDEMEAERAQMAERHAKLLERVTAYRRDDITMRQLISRATGWVSERKVGAIFIDVLTDLRVEGGWEQLAEDVRLLRNFAIRNSVPVIAAAHVTADPNSRGGGGPPRMGGVAGGRALDRRARLMLGLWNKGDALRCTVLKNTEGGAKGITVEFDRLISAGMVKAAGGALIDLDAEKAVEKKKRDEEQAARAAKRDEEKRARAEARKAAKVAAKEAKRPAQASLLGGGA